MILRYCGAEVVKYLGVFSFLPPLSCTTLKDIKEQIMVSQLGCRPGEECHNKLVEFGIVKETRGEDAVSKKNCIMVMKRSCMTDGDQ